MTKTQILAFLKKEVPGEAAKLAAWRKQAANLGPLASSICVAILKSGAHVRHYSALLALRESGYNIEQHGHGSHATYHIKAPNSDDETVIHPSHTMPDLPSADQLLRTTPNIRPASPGPVPRAKFRVAASLSHPRG